MTKKREREKGKIIKMCKETKPPEKAAKPTFNVNKEPMITSIDFKENSKSGRKGEIKIQTDSLDRFKLTNEVKEVESEDKEERNKVVNSGKSVRPKNGADKKGKENGKTKPDQSPVEKKRNIHFSLKVNKDSLDIEPEDLIFEHNQQRQQLIQAQELLIVNNKIDEAIIDVLGSVVEKLGTSEIKEAMISILNLLRGRRSMTKNDLNKIKINLSENLGKIIENTKLYCEKTFVYSNKIELTSIESKLKTS